MFLTVADFPAILLSCRPYCCQCFPAVTFGPAVAGVPCITGVPAVAGILVVSSIPVDPFVLILAGIFTYCTVE